MRNAILVLVVFCFGGQLSGQATGTGTTQPSNATNSVADKPDCLSSIVKSIQQAQKVQDEALRRTRMVNALKQLPVYICEFAADPIRAKLLTQAEQKRQDKQPGASSNSSGSTSLVSKGSSPWLLGFALEHGGLTQSANGNTITFRGNLANSIRALLSGSYVGSYDLKKDDPLVTSLAKLSFGISFDTSGNQSSMNQGFAPASNNFSGASAKYEIYNHRDPRDQKYRSDWNKLAVDVALAHRLAGLSEAIETTSAYQTWECYIEEDAVAKLSTTTTPDDVRQVVNSVANLFHDQLWDLPAVKSAVSNFTSGVSAFLDREDSIVSDIRKTALVTVEYNYTRQLTTTTQNVTATQPAQSLPSLSNLNLVLEKGFVGANAPELTFNTGLTLFNSTTSNSSKWASVRDYRASLQLDIPLKEIQNVGQPTLSFADQFLSLLEEPLGQQVTLNGVTVSRKGNMDVFQAKLSIPVKDSGVKIPISFTYASRTELIKEKDVRGNIGVTFDLDSLFSQAK